MDEMILMKKLSQIDTSENKKEIDGLVHDRMQFTDDVSRNSAYVRFAKRIYPKLRTENPDAKLSEIGAITGQMWREMDSQQRQMYLGERKGCLLFKPSESTDEMRKGCRNTRLAHGTSAISRQDQSYRFHNAQSSSFSQQMASILPPGSWPCEARERSRFDPSQTHVPSLTFQAKLAQWRDLTKQLLLELMTCTHGSDLVYHHKERMDFVNLQAERLERSMLSPTLSKDFKMSQYKTDGQLNTRVQPGRTRGTVAEARGARNHLSLKRSRCMRKRIRDAKISLLKQALSKSVQNGTDLNPQLAADQKLWLPPQRPLTPYMRFSTRVYESVRAQHPTAKLADLGKLTGEMWRHLDQERKKMLITEYENEKAEYNERMQGFASSLSEQRSPCLVVNQFQKRQRVGTVDLRRRKNEIAKSSELQCIGKGNDDVDDQLARRRAPNAKSNGKTSRWTKKILVEKMRKLKKANLLHEGVTVGEMGRLPVDIAMPPAKPLTPYMRFSTRMYETMRIQYPHASLADLGRITGQMWRDLDPKLRQPLIDEYQFQKDEYLKQLTAYKEHPYYKQYVEVLNRSHEQYTDSNSFEVTRNSAAFMKQLISPDGKTCLPATNRIKDVQITAGSIPKQEDFCGFKYSNDQLSSDEYAPCVRDRTGSDSSDPAIALDPGKQGAHPIEDQKPSSERQRFEHMFPFAANVQLERSNCD